MFEGLLEIILQRYFGQYIYGVDKSHIHLGVWSGNLLIENVRLKQEIIDLLELPIYLKFSFIESLQIVIPWSKLSKLPARIFIQNIFVILSPKTSDSWKLEELENVQSKIKTIENFIKQYFEDKSKKQKADQVQNKNQEGFFDRMLTKIFDNIEIKVSNIHIRYENDIAQPFYSCGITVNSINIITMDKDWQAHMFIDRSSQINKNLPINKKLEMKKFGIYWNSQDDHQLGSKEEY